MRRVRASQSVDLAEMGDNGYFSGDEISRAVNELEAEGKLLRCADGKRFVSARKYPQRNLNLVLKFLQDNESGDSEVIGGDIDGHRVFLTPIRRSIFIGASIT